MRGHLQRLGEARDFKVASDDPDVRGWSVRTREGQMIGQVDELIVDTEARKVRYLDVALDRRGLNLERERHVSIPIDSVQLNRAGRTVEVGGMTREAIAAMPESEFGAHVREGAPVERERTPIVEEEIVTGKRPVVKEDLVVGKGRLQDEREVEADLRHERFDVRREDRVVEESDLPKRHRGDE